MSEVLPLTIPGAAAPESPPSLSPLVDMARQFASDLAELSTADRVMVVMIEQLARTIDTAARTGKASAAAMAARELREAIAYLQERSALGSEFDPETGFVEFREFLSGSIAASSCSRCAECSHES